MEIHELRKILSKNKKYRYIYQLVIDGVVMTEKKTSLEYTGCIIEGSEIQTYFSGDNVTLILATWYATKKHKQSIALTFEALKQLKSITS